MTLTVKELPWDSRFFGIKTVRVTAETTTNESLVTTLTELKSVGIELVYVVLNEPLLDFDSDSRIVPVGGKALYHSDIVTPAIPFYSDIESLPNTIIPTKLYDLALQSGAYSRFRIDINMPKGTFEKLYSTWIENSVKRQIASEVLVYKIENKISGMITLCDKNIRGHIGLLSVDAEFRGRKIGQHLLNAANTYFLNKRKKGLAVETQLDNLQGRSFYEANNFKLVRKEHIYHYWL